MAVSVQLEYIGTSSDGYHNVKFIFYNGAPSKYPSWNYDGNYMEIYDTSGNRVWRYGSLITYTTSDYLWGSGRPWTTTARILVGSGNTKSFYAKTRDVYDEYPQYLATSATLTIIGGYSQGTVRSAGQTDVVVNFQLRTPRAEKLCLSSPSGAWIYHDFGVGTTWYWRDVSVPMNRNSARTVTYSIVNRNDTSWVLATKTLNVATTYTNQVTPKFTLTVNGNTFTISWTATSEPNYPSGNGVSRTDTIRVTNSSGATIASRSDFNFRNAGSWSFSSDSAVIVTAFCSVSGLWNSSCVATRYDQTFYSNTATPPPVEPEPVEIPTVGYVKIAGAYKMIKGAYVKMNGVYKRIHYGHCKSGGTYKRKYTSEEG